MSDYYDRAGNPIDMMQWAMSFEHDDRQIARFQQEGTTISTVYMGIDHRFGGDGPPLIFETMIFGGPLDGETWRYSTEAEALAGHEAVVQRWRMGASLDDV